MAFHLPPDQTDIPWLRFWCPLGASIDCGENGQGFLSDPENEFGHIQNPNIKPLAEFLPETGPVVLCGAPGMGKTRELKFIRQHLTKSTQSGDHLIWINFRESISQFGDFRSQTAGDDQWQKWRLGNTSMTLVVDGVDEGLLLIPNFVSSLTGLLRNEPVERLKLLIACRTAEWPVETGAILVNLWKDQEDNLPLELCPLRYKDVELAAQMRGLNGRDFLNVIWERQAAGLAARPVTLFFLIEQFRTGGGKLPTTHRELYEMGTKSLSNEIDPVRAELLRSLNKTAPAVTGAQRLLAAQRLAAIVLTTGKSAIKVPAPPFESLSPGDLALEVAVDSRETDRVSEEALREALETALFTSVGERRFGFAHQTFAECLAAQYLCHLPLIQLRQIFCRRDENGEHIVPQLSELAAWVAGWNFDFLDHVLLNDPEVLLRSDVSRIQTQIKEKLVQALLERADRLELFDDVDYSRFLGGLKHPTLASQLRPFIVDQLRGIIVRRLALRFAENCKTEELEQDLLEIVHSNSPANLVILDRAAHTLSKIIPDERLHILEPLARGEVGPGNTDEVRGPALRRLVPGYWRVRTALPFLSPLRNPNLHGLYHMFAAYELPSFLEDEDVIVLLAKFRDDAGCLSIGCILAKAADAAFARALDLLASPQIADAVATTWNAWAKRHEFHHLHGEGKIYELLTRERSVRRDLAKAVLNHRATDPQNVHCLCEQPAILSSSEDLDWLLDELPSASSDQRAAWVIAICQMTFFTPERAASCWDKLLLRIGEIPELRKEFEWLRAWEIDDPEMRKRKALLLRDRRRQESFRREMPPRFDAQKAVRLALEQIKNENSRAWVTFWHALVREGDTYWSYLENPEIDDHPAWLRLLKEDREAAVRGARRFLLKTATSAQKIQERSAAGLAANAAVWLLRDAIKDDSELQTALEEFWIDALVFRNLYSTRVGPFVFDLAYRRNPGRITASLLGKLKDECNGPNHYPRILQVAELCWDEKLASAAVNFVSNQCHPSAIQPCLEKLANVVPASVRDYAITLLAETGSNGDCYAVSLFGALVWGFKSEPLAVWNASRTILEKDDSFATCFWLNVCYRAGARHEERIFGRMDEEGMAGCYLMLRRLFPPEGDPVRETTFVSPRDEVGWVRNSLPRLIVDRGTLAACKELLRISEVLPKENPWMLRYYREAVTIYRRKSWEPMTPSEVVSLVASPRGRFIRNEDDLMDVVMESLDRLQSRLTSESLPAIGDLWNWEGAGQRRHRFRPKDEEALSNYVATHLKHDIGPKSGVVINREVQPRIGQRTDILVEATALNAEATFRSVTIVVEVKGCWHTDVRSALKSQLVNGYLRSQNWTHGIYLVGWFVCERWSPVKNSLKSQTYADAINEVKALAEEFDGRKNAEIVKSFVLNCEWSMSPASA